MNILYSPLFRVPSRARLLASATNSSSSLSNKAQRRCYFTPAAYASVAGCFFCLQNVIIYEQRSSLPVNLGTLGIPSCVTSKQDAFNRIGFQQRPRNSRPSATGEPIRCKCRVRKNAAHPSMIDTRRWKWQVMDPRLGFFNNTASYVNQTLKMHARVCVYIHWRRGPPRPATQ